MQAIDGEDGRLRVGQPGEPEHDARRRPRAHRGGRPRGVRDQAGREHREQQPRATRETAARDEPSIGARHQGEGERRADRGDRWQGALREPGERDEAQAREDERHPAQEVQRGGAGGLADGGRRAEPGGWVDERDVELVVARRGRERRSRRPDVLDHGVEQPAVADDAPRPDDRQQADQHPDERPRQQAAASAVDDTEDPDVGAFEGRLGGQERGCAPSQSVPAAPSQRRSGSGAPSPGLSTTTHSTS